MTRAALLTHVADLRRHLGTRREVHHGVRLPGLELSTAYVPDDADIDVDVVLESIFEGIVVAGRITAPWIGECRRCLADVQGHLEVDVREIFESAPTEGDTWPLHGDGIDLEPLVRDAVLLSLPLAPLCRPDCAGPAPDRVPVRAAGDVPAGEAHRGGADAEPTRDPRWAALDDLRLGDDGR